MSTAMLMALGGVLCLGLGLLIGRYYVPDNRRLERAARRAEAYVRTLNLVLDDDREAATAEIRRVLEENTDDLEPYFALGALFRARGEWERAVRVHQALALRAPKDKAVRRRALFALGRDFRRAGMPRRATRALEHCLELDGKHAGALAEIAVLYEEQGYYRDAAEALERRARARGEALPVRVHHLLVAAAQRAIQGGDLDDAKRLLRAARRVCETSVHVLVADAELAAARRDPGRAGKRLIEAVTLAPELAPFLVPALVEAQRARAKGDVDPDDEHAARVLNERVAARAADLIEPLVREDEPYLRLALAELRSHFEPVQALADYHRLGAEFPYLLPAQVAAARLALASGHDDEIRTALKHLAGAGGMLDWAVSGTWRCSRCGHRQGAFFWRCRGCRVWGSVRLDLGPAAVEIPQPPPWEHLPGGRGGVQTALLGAVQRSLPAPEIAALGPPASAFDDDDLPTPRPRSLLGRIGAWFTGGGRRDQADPDRDSAGHGDPDRLALGRGRDQADQDDSTADDGDSEGGPDRGRRRDAATADDLPERTAP